MSSIFPEPMTKTQGKEWLRKHGQVSHLHETAEQIAKRWCEEDKNGPVRIFGQIYEADPRTGVLGVTKD